MAVLHASVSPIDGNNMHRGYTHSSSSSSNNDKKSSEKRERGQQLSTPPSDMWAKTLMSSSPVVSALQVG